jgi:hypothetical protein
MGPAYTVSIAVTGQGHIKSTLYQTATYHVAQQYPGDGSPGTRVFFVVKGTDKGVGLLSFAWNQ